MRLIGLALLVAIVFLDNTACAKGTKTVHVSGYTRKDGTYVRPHMRSPPSRGSSTYSAPRTSYSVSGRSSYRSTSPTSARSTYSLGSLGSLYEGSSQGEENAGPPPYNVAPTNIFLSPSAVPSVPADKTVVGTLSAVDPNPTDTHHFTLLSDEDRFAIDGRSLIVTQGRLVDRRMRKSYKLRIAAIDQSGASFEDAVSVTVVSPRPLSARYIAYFKNGRAKDLADFLELADDYILVGIERSFGRFPKKMLRTVESIADREDHPLSARPLRDWTDEAGTHHARGSYAGLKSGKVQLHRSDDKVVLVDFERLSETDQQYVLKCVRDDDGG